MRSPLGSFFIALLVLTVLRVVMGFAQVPLGLVPYLNVLATLVFLGVPIVGIFRAANHSWSQKLAWSFVGAGLIAHFGFLFLAKSSGGVFGATASAVSQAGLMTWCTGLGAALACLLKDRNLLIPVSIFLAGFDIFLVLTPIGITQQLMQKAPDLLPTIGYQLPKVTSAAPTTGTVGTMAYVGPADFLFMGMFFVALFRFGLRARSTAMWLVAALAAYIPLAFFVGPVPLLVPIGLTVLLVNLPEFKLNTEEWLSTGLVTLILAAVIVFGATRPRPPAEPSQQEPVQALPAPGG